MASSWSNFVNNFSEEIDKIKYKHGCHGKKNVKHAELNIKVAGAFLNRQTLKMI